MDKKTGIRDIVLEQIRSLAEQHGLNRVILFGSRARGDFRERSDIDLAVSGGHIAAFSLDVDEETDTLLQYDVVNLDVPVDTALLENIQREGVTLYEKV
ncbi:nucleotidyltransferase domain-containing protein [Butyricicoccus faecihominis]|uniref:nucleotidyltransferase family protein n=1 Tax=Butyricicoccus faecihominis TaxID=1712515 RepID=UPI00247880BC|nr:nucleotidyltransferase domain-containing protein [Butyricicoccus faecihominis]MCQ5128179.1 nucleotidyltransferase domain-containing protein [Butyricicoccus faecihominis]